MVPFGKKAAMPAEGPMAHNATQAAPALIAQAYAYYRMMGDGQSILSDDDETSQRDFDKGSSPKLLNKEERDKEEEKFRKEKPTIPLRKDVHLATPLLGHPGPSMELSAMQQTTMASGGKNPTSS